MPNKLHLRYFQGQRGKARSLLGIRCFGSESGARTPWQAPTTNSGAMTMDGLSCPSPARPDFGEMFDRFGATLTKRGAPKSIRLQHSWASSPERGRDFATEGRQPEGAHWRQLTTVGSPLRFSLTHTHIVCFACARRSFRWAACAARVRALKRAGRHRRAT